MASFGWVAFFVLATLPSDGRETRAHGRPEPGTPQARQLPGPEAGKPCVRPAADSRRRPELQAPELENLAPGAAAQPPAPSLPDPRERGRSLLAGLAQLVESHPDWDIAFTLEIGPDAPALSFELAVRRDRCVRLRVSRQDTGRVLQELLALPPTVWDLDPQRDCLGSRPLESSPPEAWLPPGLEWLVAPASVEPLLGKARHTGVLESDGSLADVVEVDLPPTLRLLFRRTDGRIGGARLTPCRASPAGLTVRGIRMVALEEKPGKLPRLEWGGPAGVGTPIGKAGADAPALASTPPRIP
ncbi:MAG: hypothetical protein AB1486_26920 [Planctomycetota bacterium]